MKPVRCGELKNGFRFYNKNDSTTHLSGVGVKAGSMHDPLGAVGMAHVTEHWVARESRKHGAREIELTLREYGCGAGEGINIRTDHSSTFYGTDLLLRRQYMASSFDIFANMTTQPLFVPRGLKVELNAVYHEFLFHGEDSLEDQVSVLMHQAMYERNPARNRIDCELNDLKNMTAKSVREFWHTHYVPNNMFAVILGPDFRTAKEMAERHFGDIPSRAVPEIVTDETFPIFSGIKSVEVQHPGSHSYHVGIGFPTHPYGNEDDEAIEVLAEIMAFRAENVLREQSEVFGEGTYHPYVFISRSFLHGFMYLWFHTSSESFVREGEARFLRQCEVVKRGGLLDDEVNAMTERVASGRRESLVNPRKKRRGKAGGRSELYDEAVCMHNKLRNQYLDAQYQTIGNLSEMIIESATNRDEEMIWLNSYRERLAKVSKKRVIEVANRYLTTDNYVRVVIRP